MPATQIISLPKCLSTFRVQAGCPKTPKMKINSPMFQHWRRRRVTIHRSPIPQRFGIVTMKQPFVESDFSCLLIDANRKEIMPICRRRGYPHLPVHDHWGRPAFLRNLRFPFYVVCLAPLRGQADGFVARRGYMSISLTTAELRPIRPHSLGRSNAKRRQYQKGEISVHPCRLKWTLIKVNDCHSERTLIPETSSKRWPSY